MVIVASPLSTIIIDSRYVRSTYNIIYLNVQIFGIGEIIGRVRFFAPIDSLRDQKFINLKRGDLFVDVVLLSFLTDSTVQNVHNLGFKTILVMDVEVTGSEWQDLPNESTMWFMEWNKSEQVIMARPNLKYFSFDIWKQYPNIPRNLQKFSLVSLVPFLGSLQCLRPKIYHVTRVQVFSSCFEVGLLQFHINTIPWK